MKIGGLWTLCLVLMMGRAVADDPVASQPTGMWIDNFSVALLLKSMPSRLSAVQFPSEVLL